MQALVESSCRLPSWRPLAAGLLALLAGSVAVPATAADVAPYSAQAAPDWTALFDRRSGWTGADGVYSFPLAGDERPGSGAGQRTLIFFSDTFVGTVNDDGSRSNTTMINNSTALLLGDQPDPAGLAFQVRNDAKGRPRSMVQPRRPTDPSERYWPNDGVVIDGQVHVFALRIQDAPTPPFAFKTAGVALLSASADDAVPFAGAYQQARTPLFIAPNADGQGEVTFGNAVMPLTAAAGAPAPDGFVYVYGNRGGRYAKFLLAARVPAAQIGQFKAYRYWDGSAWVPQIERAANLTRGVSTEFSVQPLPDGRFLLVHMTEPLGRTVAVRYGASPVGPWGPDIPVWDCPEATLTANTFVYGAKAHPHLSAAGELLISYHVNSFDFWENFSAGGAAIYRPRFLRLPLP